MSDTLDTEAAPGARLAFPQVLGRDFTRVSSLTPAAAWQLLELAGLLKEEPLLYAGALRGEVVACVFERPSTGTRVSFAAAAARLGATPLALSPQELQLARGESIADTARSLSGSCAAIVIRALAQETVEELAEAASVPVINALSNEQHPCQALADVLTVRESLGDLAGRRLAFVGDGRAGIVHSLLEIGALTGLDVVVACPRELEPHPDVLARARDIARWTGASLLVLHDPVAAVLGADIVYTDVWTSVGAGARNGERARLLRHFEVTEELMAFARAGAIFLHCRPARRGREVASAVVDGPQSLVRRQSANRLPTAQALLLALTAGTAHREGG